ncbi:MAG: RidA family protein [Candidatus Hermodarchaeota archaeon]
MKKEIVTIEGITASASPFNHVVKAGKFLFLTSQLAVDLKTGTILGGDIGAQTRQALDNIKFLLHASGASMDDIVKVVVYLKKVTDFDEMNQVYQHYFKKGQEPARVTIQAHSPIKGIDIEIEAIAVLP